jgi:hypothetical protein
MRSKADIYRRLLISTIYEYALIRFARSASVEARFFQVHHLGGASGCLRFSDAIE